MGPYCKYVTMKYSYHSYQEMHSYEVQVTIGTMRCSYHSYHAVQHSLSIIVITDDVTTPPINRST